MALNDIIRKGVATAKSVTASLQADVTIEAWTGNDGVGGSTFASAVTLPALVERKQRMVRNSSGEQVLSTHSVLFIGPVTDNGADGRQEPIDPRDRITLPDGTTGKIVGVETVVDPATGAGYYQQVWMG